MSEYMSVRRKSEKNRMGSEEFPKSMGAVSMGNDREDVRTHYRPEGKIPSQKADFNQSAASESADYTEVIQAYSIEWDEGDQTIDNITLDRPPISELNPGKLFPGWSMSPSHTTAFVVFKRDLESRLQGKTFHQALGAIRELTLAIKDLPGYEDMDGTERESVDRKIDEICAGIDQLNQNAPQDGRTDLVTINRDILISGFAEKYFFCRNSIYNTYHVAGNGGGASNEAGNIESLLEAGDEDTALEFAVALLDKNFEGTKEYFIRIAQQHFLSIASLFEGRGEDEKAAVFRGYAGNEEEMLRVIKVDETDSITFTGSAMEE